jgi:hypothetical protein
MKILVAKNDTPWTDKSITRLVRVAMAGYTGTTDPVLVQAVPGTGPVQVQWRATLYLFIPEGGPLGQIANVSRRRARLDPGIAQSLLAAIRHAVGIKFGNPTAPPVVSRAKPRKRATYEDTPVGRAKARLDEVEARVRKYASLLARAERDQRQAAGNLKRMETKYAPRSYGPNFAIG